MATDVLTVDEKDLTTAAVTTAGTEICAAPVAGTYAKINLTFNNRTASDVMVDLQRYDSTSGVGRGPIAKKVLANDSLILTGIYLTPGKSLRARASAAAAVDVWIDRVTLTGV